MKLEVGKKYLERGANVYPKPKQDIYEVVGINPVDGKYISVNLTTGGIFDHYDDGSSKVGETRCYDLITEYKEPKTKDVWVVWTKSTFTEHRSAFVCFDKSNAEDYKTTEDIDVVSIKKVILTEGEYDA